MTGSTSNIKWDITISIPVRQQPVVPKTMVQKLAHTDTLTTLPLDEDLICLTIPSIASEGIQTLLSAIL